MVESRYKYLDIICVTHSSSMICWVKIAVLVLLFLLQKWIWSNTDILVFVLIVEYMLYLINWVKCIYTLWLSFVCWSQWLHGLRRRSKAARLLGSWVRIPPGARMFVCCVYCVLSGRGVCDELITHPEESYRL
jgi:hypothetical protein